MARGRTLCVVAWLLLVLALVASMPQGSLAAPGTADQQAIPEDLAFNKNPPSPIDVFKEYVKVWVGGALQLDVLHDFQAMGLAEGGGFLTEFVTGRIPVEGTPPSWTTNRTGFSINQSNFVLKVEAPTGWGDLLAYVKVNLMGDPAGGPTLRLYHGYAQWGPLMIGQYYSTLFTYATVSRTLDFEGPGAIPERVHPMIRVIQPLVYDLALVFALEVPQAEMTLPDGVTALDQVPDVLAGLQFQPEWTTIRLMGIYRRFKAKGLEIGKTTMFDDSANGWGVCLSANIDTFRQDSVQFGGVGGEGLGNYIQDTTGLGLDAALAHPGASAILPIPIYGAWIGYRHFWMYNLRSIATYSYVNVMPLAGQKPDSVIPADQGVYKATNYASINLIWSPIAPVDVGVEYLYGDRNSTTGYGDDHRLMCSMVYNLGVGF